MLQTLCMHTSNPSTILRPRQRTLPTRRSFTTINFKPSRSTLRGVVARVAAVPERSENAEAAILSLTDSLRVLETERDEAVSTAESCARTAVKLEEMIRLLEKLALNKVAEGDEAGARDVLKEKAAVSEVLARTSTRANTNFALAAKLAEKVGQQQAELMQMLSERANKSSSSGGRGSSPSTNQPYASTTTTASSSSSSGSGSSYSSNYEAPWERSLADARERIQKAQAEAAAAGDAAAWRGRETLEVGGHLLGLMCVVVSSAFLLGSGEMDVRGIAGGGSCGAAVDTSSASSILGNSDRGGAVGNSTDMPAAARVSAASSSSSSSSGQLAPWDQSLAEGRARVGAAGQATAADGQRRESIEEARERLRQQSLSSLTEARSRIRASASESIEAARARIAAEDAAVLREVHALIARYKSGQYVSEDDLDWAFRQLERRSWRQ